MPPSKLRYEYRFYKDANRIQYIQVKLCERAEELFNALKLDYYNSGRRISGSCPVHGGDGAAALVFYPHGYSAPGFWRCYSHQCEQTFGKTVLGFIRGVLSHEKGWSRPGDITVEFTDAIDWACDFLEIGLDTISPADLEQIKTLQKTEKVAPAKIDRKLYSRRQWRELVQIPAGYFTRRDPPWSREILNRYDVGYCDGEHLPDMRCRSVVPVYDEAYKHVVGYTGRSIFEECQICGGYHAQKAGRDCPENPHVFTKWKNGESFNREQHFYNLWFAKRYIEKHRKVVLVEGSGEVWRMEEAKIPLGLACFGVGLTERQEILLETLGADEVFICMNNDEPGLKSRDQIMEQIGGLYKCHPLTIPKSDFGSMTPQSVRNFLLPHLKP